MNARTGPSLDLSSIPTPDLRPEIVRRVGEPDLDERDLGPFPPHRPPVTTVVTVVAALIVLALAGFLLFRSVGQRTATASPPPATTGPVTPCSDLIKGCGAERVPDLVLRNGQTLGALGPIDGMDISGILTSDEALRRDGKIEFYGEQAKQVRVVLGSADADALHWGHGVHLFYAIQWNGVCGGPTSVTEGGSVPIAPECTQSESSVLDATTGRFIVGGNAPGGFESPSVQPSGTTPTPLPGDPTPCSELVSGCTAERLPDLTVLHGRLGALDSVVGLSLHGIISFDDALRLGGPEAVGMHGRTVRVVLGSADADRLHWGHGTNLYYAIEWGGVCFHGSRPPGASPSSGCDITSWSTVIDAHTGTFIVEGNGPDPTSPPSDVAPQNDPLTSDTHTPQAVIVHLPEPVDLHFIDPAGEVFLDPAEPSARDLSAQAIVDGAWDRFGFAEPTSIRLAFGIVQGKPYWLVSVDVSRCVIGTQPPPPSNAPTPRCLSGFTDLVSAATGEVAMHVGDVLPPV